MRNRVLLTAGAIALAAASCAQPEPQVLSEAPRSVSANELTSPTETTEREVQPGRFIARCATEADGGEPGMTFFTDGSQNVTDHCLSRYYIGVQPAPGALYVPDDQAGSSAPTRQTEPSPAEEPAWTPAQPRTDADQQLEATDGTETEDPADRDPDSPDETDTETPGTTTPGEDETDVDDPTTSPPDGATPTTPPTTTPGSPDTSSPETGQTTPPTTGSTGAPTEVPAPANAPAPQEPPPPASGDSSTPSGQPGPFGSSWLRWPGSFLPGG